MIRCYGQITDGLHLGPSVSESDAHTTQNSAQTTVQGATGSQSPTVTAGGNVSYSSSDPSVAKDAIDAASKAITAVLSGTAAIGQQIITGQNQQQAQQQSSNSDLLLQALQAQQTLAAAQGTGGASLTYNTNNYLIWGLLGLAAIALFSMFNRK